MQSYDVIIIGAGAAGMMCAWQAAQRGRSVVVIEHTAKIGEKIRISGGGRSNFTNLYCSPANFLSQNPHFCKSALKRFDQHDFVKMVEDHGIAYHEKEYEAKTGNQNARGQLFCDKSATALIDMLRDGVEQAGGVFHTETEVEGVDKTDTGFALSTSRGAYQCDHLVIATGGLSIPKIGASNFGYRVAKQFGLEIVPTRPALVPLTFDVNMLGGTKPLAGIAVDAHVQSGAGDFREGLLFTHRGVSGPSILQVSSYWRDGQDVQVNLLPETDVMAYLKTARKEQPRKQLHTILATILPTRLTTLTEGLGYNDTPIADLSDKKLQAVSQYINAWRLRPMGTEGYRTAEVTGGGVDTDAISSKTFEVKAVEGLFFIGEVLDVTGHLGGHNFQWAWSSGWCAGQVV